MSISSFVSTLVPLRCAALHGKIYSKLSFVLMPSSLLYSGKLTHLRLQLPQWFMYFIYIVNN